ncbi:adhesion G protein-coupled receptor L3-like [Lytechinus variegatus]|uniref:adhesion G protein-coupled receptor L3-like n=1 Tax=Lytechinus variegatus TaxID=7654 RepID=UPI001BB2665C|nr:adhesion G protein-coupled receptor L3-like [Lytechinus variegatus]
MKDATDKTDVITQVASDVVTAFVFIGDEKVSVPFSFNLTHSKVLSQPPLPKCGFFDTQSRNWNFSGCREIPTDNANMTSCYCDHMTSFAILVQLRPNDRDVNEIDIFIGAILTRCGIGLSVTSLIISLIFFFILRRSLAADRVIIHTNLMIAILFFDITFLFNTNPIEIEAACKSYAFILHYFSLAMMFWMLVEGVHLYRQIIRVFDSDNLRTWVYGIIGWGLPALIITITGGVRHQSYGYDQYCWLNPNDGTIWAFSGPLSLITFVNVIILALVVKAVVAASRGQLENDKIKQIRNGLRSTILLFPLLGTTWLLGPVLTLFPIRSLAYIFNVLNPLQGFFVSLFYCFLNTEVRNVIKEHFRKARDSRNLDTNSGTASTSEGKTAKSNMRLVRVAPAPVSQTPNIPEVCN